eukprot:GHVT01007157.1.p2 GENE.GHVT01007157.1~~GHVT01007157.1.p2  ORF type:complete len:106 (+),score=11.62 GHVT01007157.1:808-1125(+)
MKYSPATATSDATRIGTLTKKLPVPIKIARGRQVVVRNFDRPHLVSPRCGCAPTLHGVGVAGEAHVGWDKEDRANMQSSCCTGRRPPLGDTHKLHCFAHAVLLPP